MLRDMITGRLPTAAEIHGRQPWIPSSCPHGCPQRDTVFHRLWVCPFAEQLRQDMFGPELVTKALAAGPDDPRFTRGWFNLDFEGFVQREYMFRFYQNGHVTEEQDFEGFPVDAEVYIDGSSYHVAHPDIAHAGAAVVQLTADGKLDRGVLGRVPTFAPQSANFAEHYGHMLADHWA